MEVNIVMEHFINPKKLVLTITFSICRLLSGNQISGHLPDELGNLTNLLKFQLDINYISGPLPTSFANLANVKHLWVALLLEHMLLPFLACIYGFFLLQSYEQQFNQWSDSTRTFCITSTLALVSIAIHI